ncbi:50S ribosomal protein L11 methyltransferase [Lichenihabitans sp. Uapishka_5]|uniref:50S ribosomal protein L11 methyltransferase n=1 Tax=Lichenihabitans sp. Uapishka_5 TaxID=3037302 RepID=UPI0029E81F2B|nr:50S ribosomal protein L11 methyltransferase [Lichenihabitans sp. Uapishka_5]MDX7953134.1 50S ribosomal protein L11 methyltransferase [Lichenihabitans sp. Uapishka_5]
MLEGLPPNNAATVLRLACSEAEARAAADFVVEFFDPAETAAAAFEDEDAPGEPKPWMLEVFFGRPPDEDFVRGLLAQSAGPDCAAAASFGSVAERDWVARSLEGLHAVRAGRFLVHGAHDRDRLRSNDLGLEIEAALAFGTGHHGTTRGCLLMLDAELKRRRPRRVLDLGTGTGVLAMAAARALRQPVRCGDIDRIAVDAAAGNARLNGVGPHVRPVVSVGARHGTLRAGAPYDLIFANILAKPLRLLAPSISAIAARGGVLILSGLLARDVPGILSSYAAQGFALRRRLELEGWCTLLLG